MTVSSVSRAAYRHPGVAGGAQLRKDLALSGRPGEDAPRIRRGRRHQGAGNRRRLRHREEADPNLSASDIASEGLNLHYLSHKLIHFDIPWALLKFQQRNGRIDRYGQEREPHVWYLVANPRQEKIRGDLRILDRLIERDKAAQENIADPSVFMGTNIEEQQEDVVAEAIEAGVSTRQFDAEMDARASNTALTDDEQFAALEAFFEHAQPSTPSAAVAAEKRPTAFVDSFSFTVSALNRIKRSKPALRFEVDQADRVVTLNLPDDFRERTPMGGVASALQPRFMPPKRRPTMDASASPTTEGS